jgi:hypothetical protein
VMNIKLCEKTILIRCFVLLMLMLFTAQAVAADIAMQAKSEYKQCLRETKAARDACVYGGCGNILASCYERQIDVIDRQTNEIFLRLKQSHCEKSAEQLNVEFTDFSERILKLQAFDTTWSGFELKVEIALTKNKAFVLLESECKSKTSAELTSSSQAQE